MAFVKATGKARRSQVVSTFGIGTVTDFPSGSFMPLGQDSQDWLWEHLPNEIREAITIHEPRLQKILGVSAFLSAPIPGEKETSDFGTKVKDTWALPVARFPKWLECTSCHRIGIVGDPFEMAPDLTVSCTRCRTKVNPVRFITACRKGHIDDFPWDYWAHSKSSRCASPQLYLMSRGKSAALGDLYVHCLNCDAKRSLHDIFQPHALKGHSCSGQKPWLEGHETCNETPPTVLQRGGSNVHFPVIASMLSIPPASEALSKILEPLFNKVLKFIPEASLDEAVKGLVTANYPKVRPEAAIAWVRQRVSMEAAEERSDERSARLQEYEALSMDCPPRFEGNLGPEFENTIASPPDSLLEWFDLIASVRRLREVRAYCGFTRISPWPTSMEKINESKRKGIIAPLSRNHKNWLPAVELRGEGIFFRLREEKVAEWSRLPAVMKRAAEIDAINEAFFSGRGMEVQHRITPRLLMVHSLAHVLIRRLSLDCGYSSASLRERLFVAEPDQGGNPMAGILIYTASPDSDGSLGGLVNLTEPSRIESLIKNSIREAFWCGNDPVCIEVDPVVMGERVSGASCHNCLLMPETACEKFNRELDRGLLTGIDQQGIRGFFSDFPRD